MPGLGLKADLFFVIYQYLRHKDISRASLSQEFLSRLIFKFYGYTPKHTSLNNNLKSLIDDGYITRTRNYVRHKNGTLDPQPSLYGLGQAGIAMTRKIHKMEVDRSTEKRNSATPGNSNNYRGLQSSQSANRIPRKRTHNKVFYRLKEKTPLISQNEILARLSRIDDLLRSNKLSRGEIYSLIDEKENLKKSLKESPPGKGKP